MTLTWGQALLAGWGLLAAGAIIGWGMCAMLTVASDADDAVERLRARREAGRDA